MQTETLMDNLLLLSAGDGDERTYYTKPTNAAQNAKVCVLFLDILELVTGEKVRITVMPQHSADAKAWRDLSQSALIDTNNPPSTDDAKEGLYSGATSDDFGAWMRFAVKVVENQTPTGQVQATVNLKAVWKPF